MYISGFFYIHHPIGNCATLLFKTPTVGGVLVCNNNNLNRNYVLF